MTVREFIEYLQQQPQDIQVAYSIYSEQVLLEVKEIEIVEGCQPRNDRWVQNKRPDMPSQQYLLLPGN